LLDDYVAQVARRFNRSRRCHRPRRQSRRFLRFFFFFFFFLHLNHRDHSRCEVPSRDRVSAQPAQIEFRRRFLDSRNSQPRSRILPESVVSATRAWAPLVDLQDPSDKRRPEITRSRTPPPRETLPSPPPSPLPSRSTSPRFTFVKVHLSSRSVPRVLVHRQIVRAEVLPRQRAHQDPSESREGAAGDVPVHSAGSHVIGAFGIGVLERSCERSSSRVPFAAVTSSRALCRPRGTRQISRQNSGETRGASTEHEASGSARRM